MRRGGPIDELLWSILVRYFIVLVMVFIFIKTVDHALDPPDPASSGDAERYVLDE
jgi:hypothetical protein